MEAKAMKNIGYVLSIVNLLTGLLQQMKNVGVKELVGGGLAVMLKLMDAMAASGVLEFVPFVRVK